MRTDFDGNSELDQKVGGVGRDLELVPAVAEQCAGGATDRVERGLQVLNETLDRLPLFKRESPGFSDSLGDAHSDF